VSYNTINDLFLFVLGHIVDVPSLVQLSLTAIVTFLSIENLVNAHCLIAAGVLVLRAQRLYSHLDLGWLFMEATEAHLSYWVEFHTTFTFDQVEVGPDLPVDFLPRYTVGLSDKSYELLKIPVFIDHVLCSHLTVRINEISSLAAG
jgi:hypothetical protein